MNFDRILNCFHFSEKRKLQKEKIVTGRVHKPGGAGEVRRGEQHRGTSPPALACPPQCRDLILFLAHAQRSYTSTAQGKAESPPAVRTLLVHTRTRGAGGDPGESKGRERGGNIPVGGARAHVSPPHWTPPAPDDAYINRKPPTSPLLPLSVSHTPHHTTAEQNTRPERSDPLSPSPETSSRQVALQLAAMGIVDVVSEYCTLPRTRRHLKKRKQFQVNQPTNLLPCSP